MRHAMATAALVLATSLLGIVAHADAGPGDAGVSPVPVSVAPAKTDQEPASEPDAGSKIDKEEEPPPPTLSPERMPTLKLSVEPTEVAVGDLIVWKAELRRRVGDRAHLSRTSSFGDLDLHGKDSQVSDPDDDWVTETMIVNLIAFEPGHHEIPAQTITVVDIEGNLAELRSDAVTVQVNSLIANEPEPEMKSDTGPGVVVLEEDYTLLYIGAVIGGIIVIALLTLLGRKLWSMRGPRQGPPPPPPRPAEEIALEKLEALKSSSYLDEGRHKVFHVTLSEAFREYLGNRYRFHSLDRSTEELLVDLRRSHLKKDLFNKVVNLLGETDLVKFAKFIPGLEDSNGMLDEAFHIVDVTTMKKAPAGEDDAEKAEKNDGVDDAS